MLEASGHLDGLPGGPGEAINILPMSSRVNLSEFKRLENQWAEFVGQGSTIDVTITPVFAGTSRRPTSLRVSWSVDGVPQIPRTFRN